MARVESGPKILVGLIGRSTEPAIATEETQRIVAAICDVGRHGDFSPEL
jgi:hypothetical protein